MPSSNRIVISFATVILSLCMYACKDYIETPEMVEEYTECIPEYNNILPVHLEEFNVLSNNETKSSFTRTNPFLLDSTMLNIENISQVNRNNGLVFTQIPFYFNDSSVFAAISDDMNTLDEHKVTIKSFYIIAEDCINNIKIAYIATMIPTKEYHKHNSEYDFLNMHDYSGFVFYSDYTGRVFKINALKDGIIRKITLSHETTIDNPKYVGFYSNNQRITKSDQDPVLNGGVLTTIVITDDSNNQQEDIITIGRHPESPSQEKHETVIDHIEKPLYGGGIDTTILQNEYTLTIKFKGCCGDSEQMVVAPIGKRISITAKDFSSDTCIFMHWEGNNDILSNNRSINLTLSCNTTILAYYMGKSKGECFNLAKIASDGTMKLNMKAIIDSTQIDSTEHGYKMRSDGSKLFGKGTDSTLHYNSEPGQTYIQRFHTHPKGTPFCSGADIWTIYDMLNNEQIKDDDIDKFRYGMIARDMSNKGEHSIHIIKITDKNKLKNFCNQYIQKYQSNNKKAKNKFCTEYDGEMKRLASSYDGKMLIYLRYLDNMGLSLITGNCIKNETNNATLIYWNNVQMNNNTGSETISTQNCNYEY